MASQLERTISDLPDGVVGFLSQPDAVAALHAAGVALVTTSGQRALPGVPRVGVAEEAVGAAAADHLRGLGLAHFVAVGVRRYAHGSRRVAGFVEAVRPVAEAQVIWLDEGAVEGGAWLDAQALAARLRALPKPVGVFAFNDGAAEQVAEACRAAGLRVPEQVAIIGADNDATLCECGIPPLSSVELPFEAIGYRAAAAVLDRLMEGRPITPEMCHELPPVGIVTRQSTDLIATPDADVAAALGFIREHAHEPIGVEDVVGQTGVCRTLLERRFKAAVGQTVYQHILTRRIARAQELLARTDLTMQEIALAAGFTSAVRFGAAFKEQTGQTPSSYRRGAR